MNTIIIALLILSCILIIFEIMAPGFGFFGISGIVAFIASMVLTFLYVPSGGMFVLLEVVLFASILYVIYYYAKKTNKLGNIILSDTSEYKNDKETYKDLISAVGNSITPLKPFGKVEIDGQIYEVSSVGEFIDNDVKVAVKYIKDNKIYVVKK